jgi:hypothetical protein
VAQKRGGLAKGSGEQVDFVAIPEGSQFSRNTALSLAAAQFFRNTALSGSGSSLGGGTKLAGLHNAIATRQSRPKQLQRTTGTRMQQRFNNATLQHFFNTAATAGAIINELLAFIQ